MIRTAHAPIIDRVARYYSGKVHDHGPTPQGVDWNSSASQALRFEQLLRLCPPAGSFSLNDYGCGYGALARFLLDRGLDVQYRGFDISEAMVAQARDFLLGAPHCVVVRDRARLVPADFTVASGIFNVKLDTDRAEWERYVLDTLADMADLSRAGFAFNMLTHHANPDRMRPDLYYADPFAYFEHCRRTFSSHVALLHDYPLWEFTVLVRLG